MTAPVEDIERLLAEADCGRLIADTHHTRDYVGREHGFLRCEGELVPLAGFVLRVEGMPQDQGRARLQLVAAAVNHLPQLLTRIRTLEAENAGLREALEPFAKAAGTLSAVAPDGHDDGLTISAFINCKPEREVTLSTADFTRAAAQLKEK